MLNDKAAHDRGFQVNWHDDCVDTTGKADFSNWLSSNNSRSTQDTVLGGAQHNAVMHMSDDIIVTLHQTVVLVANPMFVAGQNHCAALLGTGTMYAPPKYDCVVVVFCF